jgi:hypothetical protein
MKKIAFNGLCIAFILISCGCGPSLTQIYLDNNTYLNKQLMECLYAEMTQSELVMQIGMPTSKASMDDGEIWVYEISDGGITTSKTTYEHELFSKPTLTTTSTTSEKRAKITLMFNKKKIMTKFNTQGDYEILGDGSKNPFLRLQPPVR